MHIATGLILGSFCLLIPLTGWAQNYSSSQISNSQTSITQNQSRPNQSIQNQFSQQTNSHSAQTSSQQSLQETAIRLSREDLQQPAILEVQTSGRWLQGTVAINGQTVANLNQPRTTIRLNRWLRQGTQRIEISGRYGSIDHSLQIRFRAGGTVTSQQMSQQMSQQTRGTGSFRQTLRLIVSER